MLRWIAADVVVQQTLPINIRNIRYNATWYTQEKLAGTDTEISSYRASWEISPKFNVAITNSRNKSIYLSYFIDYMLYYIEDEK